MADHRLDPGKALLLAAGLGTRLRPLSGELPKPAWPLFDVPLAAHVLSSLFAAGVRDAVVNLHHLPEVLRRQLEPWVPAAVRIRWSPEERILGTGGALGPWREHFAGASFLVANADTYQDLDVAGMLRTHRARGGIATLALRRLPAGSRAPLEVGADGRIVRFLNARAPGLPPGEPCEFSGVHVLEPEILDRLPQGHCCINTDVHAPLVEQGERLFGYVSPQAAFWSDLGTPERYLEGHFELLRRREIPDAVPGRCVFGSPESAADGTAIHPPSYLGPGVQLAAGAEVGPFAVLGRNARVGRGAKVAHSVLWPDASVGAGEKVRGEIRSSRGGRLAAAPIP